MADFIGATDGGFVLMVDNGHLTEYTLSYSNDSPDFNDYPTDKLEEFGLVPKTGYKKLYFDTDTMLKACKEELRFKRSENANLHKHIETLNATIRNLASGELVLSPAIKVGPTKQSPDVSGTDAILEALVKRLENLEAKSNVNIQMNKEIRQAVRDDKSALGLFGN